MFGDSRRKLRAWYQAEDPSQAEEVCMDDSNPETFNAMPSTTFVEAGRAVYRTFIEQLFLRARSDHDASYQCPDGTISDSACDRRWLASDLASCLPSIWRLSRLIFL